MPLKTPTLSAASSAGSVAAHWACLSPTEALQELGADLQGLDDAAAAVRLAQYGPNALPRPPKRPWYLDLTTNLIHFFALVLWAAAALSFLAGMPQLAWAIIAVILVNGVFSYWQQYQAERAIGALEALLPREVTVRRDGRERRIRVAEVVPGDLLILSEGDSVPADARLTQAEYLRIDAASLTGESRPVPRTTAQVSADRRLPAEFPNLVCAGTNVVAGRGEAVVFATGGATEFGRIARLTQLQRERPSPLEIQLAHVTRLITALAVTMGVSFYVIGTRLAGLSTADGFVFGIGIIVANVPEGLLPTISLALALAVRRMAARRALVKRLEKVEALGATTVIVTDKTGTLTENEMTVREAWTDSTAWRLTGVGYDPMGSVEWLGPGADDRQALEELLRAAALCCDARLLPPQGTTCRWKAVGDPTEAALVVAAHKIGLSPDALAVYPRLAELPFDSSRRRMTTILDFGGLPMACVKGAPSELFPLCTSFQRQGAVVPFDAELLSVVQTAHDALARRGLRVLAVATRALDPCRRDQNEWRRDEVERELTLVGLVAMEDPPRPEVAAAIASCRKAGIRIIMATGDNGLTAAAIGREIGLHGEEVRVVNGAELEAMDDGGLDQVLRSPELLFARVSPEHKLRLVESLQRGGEVVAVTGDGVNDAPALKRAEIGVAMGICGTDVAREAADMVLTDDNFASIVAAVEEGRAVYDNARKFVTYILASNVPEIVPFLAFVLLRIPLPLTVMQILAVDLGTDLLPALALGAETPESDVMRRQPRRRSERLVNLATLMRAYLWLGPIEAACCLGAYFYSYWLAGWQPGMPLPDSGPVYATATTMSLAGIVTCQVGNALACRSQRHSIFEQGLTTNRLLLCGIAVEVALLAALIYIPPLAAVFGLAPLGSWHWLFLVAFPPLLLAAEEGRKAIVRQFW